MTRGRERSVVVATISAAVFCFLPLQVGAVPEPDSAAAVSVVVDSVAGKPGERVTVGVILRTAGLAVAAIQNDISFFPGLTSLVGCVVNPDISKELSAFAYSFSGVRAIVLGNNVDLIPDGAVLYTCTFDVQPDAAAGSAALNVSRVVAAAPSGERLSAVGVSGAIVVPDTRPTRTPTPTATPVRPLVYLGFVFADAGETVRVTATLVTGGELIAGTQNDITFDNVNAPIVALENGKPDCFVNPVIDKRATSFAFRPPGCSGASCTGVRAIVLAADNSDPIRDGFVLYACAVTVASGAPDAAYPLTVSGVVFSTPEGQEVPNVTSTDGVVNVGAPDGHEPHKPHTPPAPAGTDTEGAVPTATATARASRATSDASSPSFSEGDGCAVDPTRTRPAGLILLLPVLGWWMGRRSGRVRVIGGARRVHAARR